MKARTMVSLVVVALAATVFAREARGQTGIIITGADATADVSTVASPTLNSLIANVEPRFLVQYANTIQYNGVTPIPSDLQTLLGQVADRFIIQYANSNQTRVFSYPVGLIGDNVPPQITDITSKVIAIDSATILWVTDEFATSAVFYGTQSGVYSQTATDLLFAKQHSVTLTGLTRGTRYYYVVRSTDRSGNTSTSSERNFIQVFLYLPLILR